MGFRQLVRNVRLQDEMLKACNNYIRCFRGDYEEDCDDDSVEHPCPHHRMTDCRTRCFIAMEDAVNKFQGVQE